MNGTFHKKGMIGHLILGSLLVCALLAAPRDGQAREHREKGRTMRPVPQALRHPPPYRGRGDAWVERNRHVSFPAPPRRHWTPGFAVSIFTPPVRFGTVLVGGAGRVCRDEVYYVSPPPRPEPVRVYPPAPLTGGCVSVAVDLLNVRSGPGMDHSVTRRISRGNTLVIHGTAPGWLYVSLPDGAFGWVMSTYTVTVG